MTDRADDLAEELDDLVEPDDVDDARGAAAPSTAEPAGPVGDELPADLQPDLVDPEDYVFPNNNRRRVPGYLYLAIAAVLVVLYLATGDGPFVNRGLLLAAGILVAVGAYSILSGWNLAVDERDALVAAVGEVGFPVGHASAQMGWRGLLSRPTWRVLLYSADEPPTKRGFVLVDGVDGAIIDSFVEDNPEDWSELED
ncbi:MAG: hypothetical protein AAGA93_01080 [Actinomycetota bacterium]